MKETVQRVELLKKYQLFDLSEFIVYENINHHLNSPSLLEINKDINSIFKEELNFFDNSKIYFSTDGNNSIIGSIRIVKWNHRDILPIQKLFGIDPLLIANKVSSDTGDIFHIGRFAIKKGVTDTSLLKQLMVMAVEPICKHKNNMAFAECDKKLLRILYLLGIKASIIGESIEYLGSETVPILLSYNSVISFYKENIAYQEKSTVNI
ncbi:hypothetical protein [Saccharicrinis aurantiacus]|uniref:hypothetical protein n=1 Tax=Saccharicrinis aurantiacus TaxID=1849719 RepID=UPI0009F8D0D0|nr:hypothetical protein [Saccharicrinis aurantiacus]